MRRAACLGVVLAVLGTAAIRVRLLDVPLERDEGEYAYIGALLLDGIPPYSGAYTMKLPGTPLMYALAMAVFGRTTAGIRMGLLLASSATTVILFLLARRLLGSVAAFAAAVAFACLSITPSLLATYAHATHFVVLFAVAGLLALTTALESTRLAWFVAAGMLLGAAIMMKQPGAVFAGVALCWIVGAWWGKAPRRHRPLIMRLLALAAGVLAPLAATGTALWAAGTFDSFWFWAIDYAQRYAIATPVWVGAERLRGRVGALGPSLWGLGVLSLVGLLALLVFRSRQLQRVYLAGLFLFSLMGVCAGLYFRPHYFILLAPAAALLVGLAVEQARAWVSTSRVGRATPALLGVVVVLAAAQSIWIQRHLLFTATPTQVSRALYAASPFPEAVEVARYLREHTEPTDTIAVLGSEPEILFHARRRSATGHLYVYWLMEAHSLARSMQAQMIAEIERARPRYVVYVRSEGSWSRTVLSERLVFDWMAAFLPLHYVRVGQVDIRGPSDTRYLWDQDLVGADVTPYTHLIVFRRVRPG